MMNIEDPTELYCLNSELKETELTFLTNDILLKDLF